MKRTQTRIPGGGDGRQMSAAARRRQRIILRRRRAALSIVVFIIAAVGLGYWLTGSELFKIKYIEIEGVERMRDRDIYNESRTLIGAHILFFDAKGVEARLEGEPWIKSASIRRTFPDKVAVSIEERKPFAYVTDQTSWHLIDKEMVLLSIDHGPKESGVIEVACERVEEPRIGAPLLFPMSDKFAETIKAAEGPMAGRVSKIVFRQSGITMHLTDGPYLLLGNGEDLERKLRIAPVIIEELKKSGKEFVGLNLIDLETPSYIVHDA